MFAALDPALRELLLQLGVPDKLSAGLVEHISDAPNGAERLAEIERAGLRSEEHTSELQSLMRTSYAVFCLTKKNHNSTHHRPTHTPSTERHTSPHHHPPQTH